MRYSINIIWIKILKDLETLLVPLFRDNEIRMLFVTCWWSHKFAEADVELEPRSSSQAYVLPPRPPATFGCWRWVGDWRLLVLIHKRGLSESSPEIGRCYGHLLLSKRPWQSHAAEAFCFLVMLANFCCWDFLPIWRMPPHTYTQFSNHPKSAHSSVRKGARTSAPTYLGAAWAEELVMKLLWC